MRWKGCHRAPNLSLVPTHTVFVAAVSSLLAQLQSCAHSWANHCVLSWWGDSPLPGQGHVLTPGLLVVKAPPKLPWSESRKGVLYQKKGNKIWPDTTNGLLGWNLENCQYSNVFYLKIWWSIWPNLRHYQACSGPSIHAPIEFISLSIIHHTFCSCLFHPTDRFVQCVPIIASEVLTTSLSHLSRASRRGPNHSTSGFLLGAEVTKGNFPRPLSSWHTAPEPE